MTRNQIIKQYKTVSTETLVANIASLKKTQQELLKSGDSFAGAAIEKTIYRMEIALEARKV